MLQGKTISCLIVDDEAVARDIILNHLKRVNNINVVASCSNAIEAFNYINTQNIDLIFLDINMPEISGISFAKSINKSIKVIFTTAYRDYAVEGFELRAVDYLLKPISFERLLQAINTYFEVHTKTLTETKEQTQNAPFMFVRSDRKMIKVDFDDIIYIESYSDYIKIHSKEKTIVTRETISAVEAKLDSKKFLRIHRSYIISLKSISSFTSEQITISKIALPISRSYKKDVLKILEKF